MKKIKDLTGSNFGRLTVIKYLGKDKNNKSKWLCKCKCGKETEVLACHLQSGKIQSCGCYGKERRLIASTKHGMRYSKLYNTWLNIKNRCYNKNNPHYKNYGERGIVMCKEWSDDFVNFYNWAKESGYQDILTIDRIDNNYNYEPSNCRWVNRKTQNRNKRSNHFITYNGLTLCLTEWAEKIGVNEPALRKWLKRNGEENIGIYINKKLLNMN